MDCRRSAVEQWLVFLPYIICLCSNESLFSPGEFLIPFHRVSGFFGRINELERVKKMLTDPDGRRLVSVVGLGGVGKSRFALEFAHHLKSNFPQYSIFWIQATEQLTFEKGMFDVGKKLSIPGIEDEKADAKELVKQWLSNQTDGKWLLILDNADDQALWGKRSDTKQQEFSLVKYLPRTTNGSILVTTRSRRVATFLAGKQVIDLSTLSPDEAAEMFID